jgi:predicted GNAT family acetyltransferase
MAAFNEEAFSFQVSAEKLVPRLERIVAKDAAWVWEDGGKLTSMAHIVRRTRHVSGIGYVYTPHELRGKGYASQVTAAATRAELDHGKDMCVLFTDLNNPTSNRIYQRIGYRKVAEFIRISFDETGEG